jgi:hypothetical protein
MDELAFVHFEVMTLISVFAGLGKELWVLRIV